MYTEYNEHVHRLGVYQIKHVIINDASSMPRPRLLSQLLLNVLEISLGTPLSCVCVCVYVFRMHFSATARIKR